MSISSIGAQNADFIQSRANAALNGTPPSTGSDTSAAAAQTKLSGDFNFFLKLLTTQLRTQDPTAPLDVAQLTQQIAQFSGVEQQVKTNSNLEALLASNRQSDLSTAVGYIGKEIETKGATGQVVGGQGAFSYILPRAAQTARITIKDAAGATVFTGQGTTQAGRNLVVWDGRNSTSGAQEPDGIYTISVEATDISNKAVVAELRSVGIVSGVETGTLGKVNLTVGNGTTDFGSILAVREPTRASLGG